MEYQAIVIDNGSYLTKAGFAGDDAPSRIFRSVLGETKYKDVLINEGRLKCYIGDKTENKNEILDLKYPIKNGLVSNLDDMEKIWNYTFYDELKIETENQPILLTQPSLNPKRHQEKVIEIMFEKFKFPATYLSRSNLLVLYTTGHTSGIALDSGDGVTCVESFYEGYAVTPYTMRYDFGGKDICEYLLNLLNQENIEYKRSLKFDNRTVCDIKEKMSYISLDFEAEMINNNSVENYELPDGEIIEIGNERFKCTEALFNPSLICRSIPGIHEMIYNSVKKCENKNEKDLLSNIVLAGGNTLIPSITSRLEKELSSLFVEDNPIKIIAPSYRSCSAWIGGSILASLPTFQTMWISKQEYDETGPSIVHQKCY